MVNSQSKINIIELIKYYKFVFIFRGIAKLQDTSNAWLCVFRKPKYTPDP